MKSLATDEEGESQLCSAEQYWLEAVFFSAVLLLICAYCYRQYQPYSFANFDPGWMVEAVRSLAYDGDVDLRNQLSGNPADASDQIALGSQGGWYPLHELPLVLLAVPFYLAFGINGCLLLNMCLSAGLVTASYCFVRACYQPRVAAISCLLMLASSPLLFYSYSFSVDVFGAFCVASAAAAAVAGKPTLAGAALGLGVLGRLGSVCALIPTAVFIYYKAAKGRRLIALCRFVVGGLPFAACLAFINTYLFGSPLRTAYHAWVAYDGKGLAPVVSELGGFSRDLWEGLLFVGFSKNEGLFVTAPLLVLAFVPGLCRLRKRCPLETYYCVGLLFCYLGFYTTYQSVFSTERYFLAVTALAALPLAALFANERQSQASRVKDPG